MQSFKKYLVKENYSHDVEFYLTFMGVSDYENETDLSERVQDILAEKMQELHIKEILLVACWHPELHIKVKIPNTIDKQHLENEISYIVNSLTDVEDPISEIILHELPQDGEIVEWKNITINLDKSQPVSFHDIHKKIKCHYLQIQWLEKITDSILGLLNFRVLTCQNVGNAIKWQQILLKHRKSDRDLLDCQEELIANGLKQYAKL